MIHRLVIDYYTAHERHFSCFLVPFFSFVILLSVLDAFPLHLKILLTMSSCKVLITNRWFSRYVIAAMLVDGKQKIAH